MVKLSPCLKVKKKLVSLNGLVGLSAAGDKDYTSMVGCATTVCSSSSLSLVSYRAFQAV